MSIENFHLRSGTTLAGSKYCLEQVLGQGGFGITYLGWDQTLNRRVAIKEFFPEGSTRDAADACTFPTAVRADCGRAIERFLQEGQLLARLRHPGVVGVFDAFAANQTAYTVMEFIEGQTLQRLVDQNQGPLAEEVALLYIRQVAEALAEIHQQGLLHRDIKPENVMITPDGRAVLIDFGAARVFEAGKSLQQSVVLTPGYAPLEQYAAKVQLGPYTDLYALAGTLYFALTWQHPVAATDRASGVPLPLPRTFNEQISPTVERSLLWALAQRVEDRPQDARAFIKSLLGTARPALPRPRRPGQVPTLEITNLPQRLVLQVATPGELLNHTVVLANPGVGTLQGSWDTRPDSRDTQVWIRFQPRVFKGNRIESTLIVNTALLQSGATYHRWLELVTNAEEGNRQVELVVEVAPNDFVQERLRRVYRQLGGPAVGGTFVLGGLWGFWGGRIPVQAFMPMVGVSSPVLKGAAVLVALGGGWLTLVATRNRGYEEQVGVAGGCLTGMALLALLTTLVNAFTDQLLTNPQPWGNALVYGVSLGLLVFVSLWIFVQFALKPQFARAQRTRKTIQP
ncbi:serine/threonine protein kinase [Anthocerotibacter panamensis]|uniref:serine/threonine protein kinase n=1 Tax=Anthocerotibacter panamensis TaxID=2857077 RepID=UPI001C406BF6|nr:serine/threonine-protein kinase [Anthocerotibacter panamensis]